MREHQGDAMTVYTVVRLADRAEVSASILSGYMHVDHMLEQVLRDHQRVTVIVSCKEFVGLCCMGYGVITSKVIERKEATNTERVPAYWKHIARIAWVKIGTVPHKGESSGMLSDLAGQALCDQIDASARTVMQVAGPSRSIKTTAARGTQEVAGLCLEDYTIIVMNRRRQLLRKAEALRDKRAAKRKRTEALHIQQPQSPDMVAQSPLPLSLPSVQSTLLTSSYLSLPQTQAGQGPLQSLQNLPLAGLGSTQFMR
eukprot:TRINITY_DN3407_c0_g1_i1.p1 TRINITY_DN3407_c0_g1~~TRINITY_DN3407_c0_g1_i1.p1  ORF type:complete len:256 (+),score=48.37 TRINITY_DN3407_c0_g1_i1:87-854(+)